MQASTYELFFAGVISESEKQAILDKYFDPDLCDSQQSPVSAEFNLHIHPPYQVWTILLPAQSYLYTVHVHRKI